MRNLKNIRIDFPYYRFRRFHSGLHTKLKKQEWKSVVGLEIHVQINSISKLFSGASTQFGKPVNTCVSFFDCATPGTLPVINKRSVEAGVLTALALSCQLNEISMFDRKHYFYSDLPESIPAMTGYQITQQRQPLAFNGELKFSVFTTGVHQPYIKTSKIKQLQLEQDSGKSLHDTMTNMSLIDLNRAGIPLMEIVFEPDLTDGYEASALVKELICILKRINTSSCKMGEGALRVDANISVHRPTEPLGVRTEIKNLGSIHSLLHAVNYEISRQMEVVKKGEKIFNETLSWDPEHRKTVPMRDKEKMQDYRFMPEPNLPPLRLHMKAGCPDNSNLVDVNKLAAQIPRLPEQIREYFRSTYGLTQSAAATIVNSIELTQLFENIMVEKDTRNPKTVYNILLMELMEFINKYELELKTLKISTAQLGELVDLLESKKINITIVKKVLSELMKNPEKMPFEIINAHQWYVIDDETELIKVCQSIIDDNPEKVAAYKAGKHKVIRALFKILEKIEDERINMAKGVKILEDLLKKN